MTKTIFMHKAATGVPKQFFYGVQKLSMFYQNHK